MPLLPPPSGVPVPALQAMISDESLTVSEVVQWGAPGQSATAKLAGFAS
jgi:hypothetical protein